jgi:diguanylate cyclase (GGDEF)-like protein/PAS domain S-box-containing protein
MDSPVKKILDFDLQQTILLVDDRPDNLASLEALLENGRRHLLKASSGEEALQILLDHDVSLVLLDVQMPFMSGYEVAKLMRGNRKTRNIPIIFITAIARDEAAAIRGYQAGAIDYITKPVNALVLQSKVALFLELDLSKRQLQQSFIRLEHTKAYYESMLNAAGEGVIGIDVNGHVKFINPAALSLLASSAVNMIDQEFRFFPVAANVEYGEVGETFIPTGSAEGTSVEEALFQRSDGSRFLASYCCSPLAGKIGGVVVVFQDITSRREMEEELRQQTVTDHLTGLTNRNGFKLALQAALERARRANNHVALMFIDLDHFKRINDNLGHDVGDLLLRSVALRLKEQIRCSDVFSRIGGDEFTVVLGDLEEPQDAAMVGRKILNALRLPFTLKEDMRVIVSASIGIASFPDCGDDIDTLMRAADVAMYQAKRDGRNLYAFYMPEMNARDRTALVLEQALRLAVEYESFELHYQPQVELATGRLVGLEALLRWKNGELGNVEPASFVPILEDTGLMVRTGQWVFNTGCRQRMQWHDVLPEHCTIALNLSQRQFADKNLVNEIRRALEENKLPPWQLELELTESMLMVDTSFTQSVLYALKEMGIRLSIDDFGTGYSSLAYLKQFPLDALKIDRQFIHNLTTSNKDAAIATSIIQLAHNLGLQVVAEGVENAQQVEMLKELGCDIAQGYYFSRAVPANKIPDFPHLSNLCADVQH